MPASISVQQRRARLGVRHGLASRATGRSPAELADDLLVLHATDPASVYLSLAGRSTDLTPADIGSALYADRTLIRMLGMRRTMFVVPTPTVPVVQHSSTDAVAARLRRAMVKDLGAVVPDPDGWLAELETEVVDHLRRSGGTTGTALSRAVPGLQTKIVYAEGKSYGGAVAINSRVLNIMSAHGSIVRGRPGGDWTSSRYEWAPIGKWLPTGIPALPAAQARTELARRWLARFGPGTIADLVWWTGWNRGDTLRAIHPLDTVSVDVDGVEGLLLADDADPVAAPAPWVALLPALDPTPMGWFGRDWYLDPAHRSAIFDRTGNIGPSIWCDGRIVGGWGQRPDASVVTRLFEDIGTEQTAAVAAEAERLTEWMAGIRVVPKFRTPLERELAGSDRPGS